MKTRTMTRTQAELLLAAVIIARSTSYVLTKVGLQDMGKFTLLAVRFLLAFAFLAALFRRRLLQIDRRTLLSGLAMGGIYFCVMTAELTALKTVETSTVSFVTNTAVVIVPLIQAALSRRWPERRVLFGALACLLGVALLTLRGGLTLTPGVGYCILEAFLYSTAILVTDRLTHAGADPLLSGVVQVGFLGALALIASFLFETPHLPGSGTEEVPPMSEIHGVDLTTEGVVTVNVTMKRIKDYLADGMYTLELARMKDGASKLALVLLEEATEVNVLFGNASNLAQQDTEFSFERKLQLVQELRDMLTLAGKTVKMSIC